MAMLTGRTVVTILGALASIATILTLVITLHDRYKPTTSVEVALTPTPAPETPAETPQDDDTPDEDTPEPIPEAPTPPKHETQPPRAPEFPLEVTLKDNEQTVFLSGQASVGVQFNRIGEEQFLTLRINSGNDSRAEAVLGGGARFPLKVGGAQFFVSVLGIDYTEKTAHLRVDRTDAD